MAYGNPTAPRRRLAYELTRLYASACERDPDLTLDTLSGTLGKSESTLSRIFRGKTRCDHYFLPHLLDAFGVAPDDPIRAELTALAKRSSERGWWGKYSDVIRGPFVGFEASADVIRCYESELVPGLLQTEAYARAVMRAAWVTGEAELDRRVNARQVRQRILSADQPTHVRAVLGEAVVRRPVGGPAVMAEQLRHLATVGGQPHVTVQVLPLAYGAHPAMTGPFTLMEGTESSPVAYVENDTQGWDIDDPKSVARYRMMHDHLSQAALSVPATAELLEGIARDWESNDNA